MVVTAGALLFGCNAQVVEEAKPVVQGKLTKGGQPITVDPTMGDYAYVQAIFMPPGGLPPYNVRVANDGSFTIARDDGEPLPTGQYRVAVRQWEPYPMTDKLGGKFDERNTPITVEITNPPKDLVIDLDKPQG
jgi:hypothetical protein